MFDLITDDQNSKSQATFTQSTLNIRPMLQCPIDVIMSSVQSPQVHTQVLRQHLASSGLSRLPEFIPCLSSFLVLSSDSRGFNSLLFRPFSCSLLVKHLHTHHSHRHALGFLSPSSIAPVIHPRRSNDEGANGIIGRSADSRQSCGNQQSDRGEREESCL